MNVNASSYTISPPAKIKSTTASLESTKSGNCLKASSESSVAIVVTCGDRSRERSLPTVLAMAISQVVGEMEDALAMNRGVILVETESLERWINTLLTHQPQEAALMLFAPEGSVAELTVQDFVIDGISVLEKMP